MSALLERLRASLRAAPVPVDLAWHVRHRRRFLHEYHEMKARADADLYRLDGALVWLGRFARGGEPVSFAIRYAERHPAVAPRVFVLEPAWVAATLPTGRDGAVEMLAPGAWHSGLTVYDLYCWLRRLVGAVGAFGPEEQV